MANNYGQGPRRAADRVRQPPEAPIHNPFLQHLNNGNNLGAQLGVVIVENRPQPVAAPIQRAPAAVAAQPAAGPDPIQRARDADVQPMDHVRAAAEAEQRAAQARRNRLVAMFAQGRAAAVPNAALPARPVQQDNPPVVNPRFLRPTGGPHVVETIDAIKTLFPRISIEWLRARSAYQVETLANYISENEDMVDWVEQDDRVFDVSMNQDTPVKLRLRSSQMAERRDAKKRLLEALLNILKSDKSLNDNPVKPANVNPNDNSGPPSKRLRASTAENAHQQNSVHVNERRCKDYFTFMRVSCIQALRGLYESGITVRGLVIMECIARECTVDQLEAAGVGDEICRKLRSLADKRFLIDHSRKPTLNLEALKRAEPAFERLELVLADAQKALDTTAKFECTVCFDEFSDRDGIKCVPHDDNAEGHETHIFCKDCVRGHAAAACGEVRVAEGGVGLTCLDPGCRGIIQRSTAATLLERDLRRRLEKRMDEEALRAFGDGSVERCKFCSFAVVMDAPKEVNRVFSCLKCHAEFCRLCMRDWKDHFGKKCEEMPDHEKDAARKKLEEDMTAAILRICSSCKLGFEKKEGCNKITCRCGLTQCYVCRKEHVHYDHFCNHPTDPENKKKVCPKNCGKCFLWDDPSKRDELQMQEIRQRALQDENLAAVAQKL